MEWERRFRGGASSTNRNGTNGGEGENEPTALYSAATSPPLASPPPPPRSRPIPRSPSSSSSERLQSRRRALIGSDTEAAVSMAMKSRGFLKSYWRNYRIEAIASMVGDALRSLLPAYSLDLHADADGLTIYPRAGGPSDELYLQLTGHGYPRALLHIVTPNPPRYGSEAREGLLRIGVIILKLGAILSYCQIDALMNERTRERIHWLDLDPEQEAQVVQGWRVFAHHEAGWMGLGFLRGTSSRAQ